MRHSPLRVRIEERAGGRCEYCQAPQRVCGYRFHLEHVTPVALGGSDDESNRALACASCNLAKADRGSGRDPLTGEEVLLFDPRTQIWRDHFAWAEDQRTLTGLTATGRATITTLDMNSELRQAARPFWFDAGLLPQP
jgi:HNH endonuclease